MKIAIIAINIIFELFSMASGIFSRVLLISPQRDYGGLSHILSWPKVMKTFIQTPRWWSKATTKLSMFLNEAILPLITRFFVTHFCILKYTCIKLIVFFCIWNQWNLLFRTTFRIWRHIYDVSLPQFTQVFVEHVTTLCSVVPTLLTVAKLSS